LVFLFPLSFNSLGLSLNGLGDNIGISVGVRVDPMVSVWESMLDIWIPIVGIYTMSGVWKSVGKRMSIGGDWGLNYGGACKDSRISISLTLLPLSLNSLGLSLNRLGLSLNRLDNIGMISIGVRVSVSVWESMVVCIGNSWGLNLNSLDSRLDNRCGIDIGVVDIGAVDSIGQIVWISLRVSLGLTLLPLSLNSFSFGLDRLGDNIGITMITIGVRVDSMVPVVWVSVGVWVGVCNSRCLNFHLLYNRFNQWGGINIWVVKTICQIVGISLSLSIGLSLLPFSRLHSGSLSFSGSSGSSGEWESMSPKTIERSLNIRSMKIRIAMIAIGDNWSSLNCLNLSWLYFNRLDNRYVGESMVSSKSIHKRRVVDKELRVSLSLCTDSSKEGNHQQELHVVAAL